jgi:hypothetical protein
MKFGNLGFLILIIVFVALIIAFPELGVKSGLQLIVHTTCFKGFLCRNAAFNVTHINTSFAMSQNFSDTIYNVHVKCIGPQFIASAINESPSWYALTSNGSLKPQNFSGTSMNRNAFVNVVNLQCLNLNGPTVDTGRSCFYGDVFANFTLKNGLPSPSNPWVGSRVAEIGGCLNTESTTQIGIQLSFFTTCLWFIIVIVFGFYLYIQKRKGKGKINFPGITTFLAISLTIISFILLTGIYDTIASPPGTLFDNTSMWLTLINQIISIILIIVSIVLCVKNRWMIQDEKASKIIFWVPISLSILSFFAVLPLLNSINLFTGLPFVNLVGSVCLPYELIPAILVYLFILYLPVVGSLILGLNICKNNRKFTLLILESLIPLFLAFIASFIGPVSWSLNYLSYIGFASLPVLIFMIYFAFKAPKILDDDKSRRKLMMLFAVAFSLFVVLLVLSMPLGICF